MNEPKTPNLGLNKIDRSSPSTTYFDLDKYLDQNWEKVDEGVATKVDLEKMNQLINEMDIPDASLLRKGKVQLSSAVDGTSEELAATPRAVKTVNDALTAHTADYIQHLADYVRQTGYAITEGVANAYTVTTDPTPTRYVDGMGIVIRVHKSNTGASTLKWGSLKTVPILDSKGSELTTGKLPEGGMFTLRYNEEAINFQLQGEEGVSEEFGDGSDGVLNTTSNVIIPVAQQDVTTVIKNYKSLTINAGHTMSLASRCRGLIIYVDGDVVINGTIDVTGKSAFVNPNSVEPILIPITIKKMMAWDATNKIFTVPRGERWKRW